MYKIGIVNVLVLAVLGGANARGTIIYEDWLIHDADEFDGRILLHFLPAYCPDDNRVERCAWREPHANVTRNHKCETIQELMREVGLYLTRRNRAAIATRRIQAA